MQKFLNIYTKQPRLKQIIKWIRTNSKKLMLYLPFKASTFPAGNASLDHANKYFLILSLKKIQLIFL